MGQGDRVTYSPSIDHGYSHLPMVALDRVRSGFCRRSGNHGAIRERGRFGSIRMVQMQLILELLRHGRLVDRIEENQKMVIVGVRLVSKFLPTMTLYCTTILGCCRVQLKKIKIK